MIPIIREFNKIAKSLTKVFEKGVESKERQISIMVSRISKPGEKKSNISVKTVKFTNSFLKSQRKKKKKPTADGQSEWDDGFSQKRGFMI